MAAKPPIVQRPTNTPVVALPPIVQQPGNYAPNQHSQARYFGQQPPNMAIGMGHGQPPPNMAMGYGPPQYQTPPQPVGPMRGVPIGLELLIPLNQITVKRQNPVIGVTMTPHQYDVFDGRGQRIFHALETSDPRSNSQCCRFDRDFTVDMMDSFGRKILTMRREVTGSCECQGNSILVSLSDGKSLGEVRHILSSAFVAVQRFEIKNPGGDLIMFMRGPEGGRDPHDPHLIFRTNGQQIGFIRRTYTGGFWFPILENFGVEFLGPLDVTTKALILAAVFLMDFVYSELRKGR